MILFMQQGDNTTFSISAQLLDDHFGRFYEIGCGFVTAGKHYTSKDQQGKAEIINCGKRTMKVTMNDAALNELIADLNWMIQFYDEPEEAPVRAQCKRALESLNKQINKGES